MSIPSSTKSPAEDVTREITDTQRKIFNQYLNDKYHAVNREEAISFVRLLIHDKPGMVMTPIQIPSMVDYAPQTTSIDLVEAFNLPYTTCSNGDLYVSMNEEWLAMVPEPDDQDGSQAMGRFLGYSESDIEHFRRTDMDSTSPEELVDRGIFSVDELAYTVFLPQRFDDLVEGYKDAINRGKKIYSLVTDFATHRHIPELREYTDALYDTHKQFVSP